MDGQPNFNFDDVSPSFWRAVKSLKVKTMGGGEGQPIVTETTVVMWDKMGALKMLGAHTQAIPSTVQPIPSDHNPTIADSDYEDPKGELIRRLEQMAKNISLNKTVFGPMLDITPDSVEASDPVEKKP